MKTIKLFLEDNQPKLNVGDMILIGKYRNRAATIKGFETDKNNQPLVKTNKGTRSLYRFRVNKLLPDDMKKKTEAEIKAAEEAKQKEKDNKITAAERRKD